MVCISVALLAVGYLAFSLWKQDRHATWIAIRRFTHEELQSINHNPLPPPFDELPLVESLTWTVDFVEMMATHRLQDWNTPPDGFCLLYHVRRSHDGRWERRLDEESVRNEVTLLSNTDAGAYIGRPRWLRQKRDALAHREWQPFPAHLAELTEEAHQRFRTKYKTIGKLGQPHSSMRHNWTRERKETSGADPSNMDAKPKDMLSKIASASANKSRLPS